MQICTTKFSSVEYRVEGSGSRSVLLLHGGHMNASVRLGEDYFLENGYKVVVVSRPGYGRTPLPKSSSSDNFSKVLNELLSELSINKTVVVGVSAGSRHAIKFTTDYPHLVEKLILQSAISFAKWPDLKTRIAAYIAFNGVSEKYTWQMVRFFLKTNPTATLKFMLSNMTTLDASKVVAKYTTDQFNQLIKVFMYSQSGKGFMNDIKNTDFDAQGVTVPCLIIHSKFDKSVPLSHPQLLSKQINGSELYISDAESHLIHLSEHYSSIKRKMDVFLN